MLKLYFLLSCLFLGFFTPGTKAEDEAKELYEMQYLDHFNTLDDRKFKMIYSSNGENFKTNGPMFIRISNTDSDDMLQAHMIKMAKENGAFVFQVPMRFQYENFPENVEGSDIMKYLSVEQKLEDVIHFVKAIKEKNPSLSHSKVIVFGSQFGGSLAVWLREKYPHIIDGAVVLNAYIDTKPTLEDQYEVVANNIKKWDPQCYDIIKDGFKELAEAVKANNTERISKAFNPQSLKMEDFSSFMISYVPLYGGLDEKGMIESCNIIKNTPGTPLDKIGYEERCRHSQKFEYVVEGLQGRYVFTQDANVVCTQYGQFLAFENPEGLFANAVPIAYHTEYFCPQIFGKDISGEKILRSIERTREKYGGDNPDVTKVLFIEGSYSDVAAGVRKDFTSQDSEVVFFDYRHPDFDYSTTGYDKTSKRVRSWLK